MFGPVYGRPARVRFCIAKAIAFTASYPCPARQSKQQGTKGQAMDHAPAQWKREGERETLQAVVSSGSS
jgi:hypothetical protein